MYELTDISKAFGAVRALDGIDLSIEAGEFVAVAGPSGSGKTTLLQLLGMLDRPTSGRIVFDGRDVQDLDEGRLALLRLRTIGFVFQQFNLIPTLTAAQNVEAALAPAGARRAARRARAQELLEAVGLAGRAAHLPGELSGGEQQRVAIARALANGPRVVLADEPTGNLDTATGAGIVGLLRELHEREGLTVILVTHDPAIAGAAPRLIALRDGRVVEAALSSA